MRRHAWKVIDCLQKHDVFCATTNTLHGHRGATMKRILLGTLLGFSCAAIAAQNCEEIKSSCAAGYARNIQACGPSGDRRSGICRADAHNRYIECVKAGGCEA
jgi:hypothetical protein